MKTIKILSVVLIVLFTVLSFSEWNKLRVTEVESSSPKVSRPNQTTKASSPKPEAPSSLRASVETPEMKNARIMAEVRKGNAKFAPIMDAYKKSGLEGMLNAQMEQQETEYLDFLRSLGFTNEQSGKVFQMLKAKLNQSTASRGPGAGENNPAQVTKLLQMEADLEATVGTDNYNKIKYWQATRGDRLNTQQFKAELASRGIQLSGEQEQATVDAMYQSRQGRATFGLNMPYITKEAKEAYIDNLAKALAPVLSVEESNVLIQYLEGIANKPLIPSTVQDLLPQDLNAKILGPN